MLAMKKAAGTKGRARVATAPAFVTQPASSNKVSTKAAGVVGLAVMCSRILGLIREQVFAGLFGGGRAMDAFTVAFRTPNLLRDMFAEGALSTAFVTTFSKKIATEGEESAWKLANKFATLTVVFLSVITLIGIAIAPLLIKFFAPGFDAEKAALTVLLARIMYPFILLVSLAALVMGMLNARNVFAVPAMASSFFNLGSIVGGVCVGYWIDPHFGPRALIGLAVGTLIGGALQFFVQLPSAWKVGFRFRPDFAWRDPGWRRSSDLMGPAIIAASSTQVNVMINTMFASNLGDGPIFWLQIAFRLMQLPARDLRRGDRDGIAAGAVAERGGGKRAGIPPEPGEGDAPRLSPDHPIDARLMLLAEPIISVLYQHGRFDAGQTSQAAAALRYYAIGLCAYSAIKVLVPAFYAIDRRKTPMNISFIAVGVNLVMNWFFTFRLGLGHRGLALSTGCVALSNFGILYWLMRRETRLLETRALLALLAKLAIPCALLAGACWASRTWLLSQWATMPFAPKTIYLAGDDRSRGCGVLRGGNTLQDRRDRRRDGRVPPQALALYKEVTGAARSSSNSTIPTCDRAPPGSKQLSFSPSSGLSQAGLFGGRGQTRLRLRH
jgi:putative peptidoglycan lipid II flippase